LEKNVVTRKLTQEEIVEVLDVASALEVANLQLREALQKYNRSILARMPNIGARYIGGKDIYRICEPYYSIIGIVKQLRKEAFDDQWGDFQLYMGDDDQGNQKYENCGVARVKSDG
jgi:hypothetical protein